MKGHIVYADYDIIENSTHVLLYGRLENQQSFVTIHEISPYFFVETSKIKKLSKLLKKFKVEKTELKSFDGHPVSRISSNLHIDLNKLSHAIHKSSVSTYEADIKPHIRFLIDNNIFTSIEIEGEYESSEKIDRIYKNPKIFPIEYKQNLKVLSLDTESDKSGSLFCIGLYSDNYKKNFIVSNKKLQDAISCKTESECLEKFRSELLKFDPDIITGWNLIDFDLVFLKNLFQKHKIPFDLGRSNANCKVRIESNFFRSSSADFPGRQILDGLNLIKDPFIKEAPTIKNANFDTYTLEDVSQALLKEGKLLKGKNRHEEIEKLYKSNPQKIVDYNLQDCKLAYDILEKTHILDLAIERSQLTGLRLDKLTASIAAFDSLYMREARKRNLVSPSTQFSNKEERLKGGYVKDTVPGIYHNILVLDFKSLYPSILKTFNIDPSSYLGKNKEKNAIETPNKVYFRNQQGILPEIITKLHEAREKAKKDNRELASYAIKIIMNSFWGVLASPNCRYFDFDLASSITGFAREIIQLTAKEVESKFKASIIYSDTDSIFVESKLEKDAANQLGIQIQDYINDFYKNYVRKNYHRESFLELQFQKQYLAFMQPQLRSPGDKEKGAKKRYAGLIEKSGVEKIEIIGLEAIRGDWTEAAKDFQKQLLDKVFHKEPIDKFIKEYIKNLKSGKLDEKLIYKKSIRKNLAEYTKTTPPHVKAARQLDKLDSNIIKYYITIKGPEPIQKLKHRIDYGHYIKKQIEPIANQVLSLLNKDFEEIAENSQQTKLF